jgi:hypothetical protein
MTMLAQVVFNAIVIGVYLGAFLAFLSGDKQLERALLRATNLTMAGGTILINSSDVDFPLPDFSEDFSADCEESDNTSSVINSDGRVTGL